MFGYVRAFKPQMKVCEYEIYKAVYCGLCKKMGKEFGFFSRMTLSYDFTFLALMNMALNSFMISYNEERCIAHPQKKSMCLKADHALDYPADAAIILIWHKLHDDLADKGAKGKIAAFCILPFLKKGYKKAKGRYNALANDIESLMKEQKLVEKETDSSFDMYCEPSSKMMEEIASYLSDDIDQKKILEKFGYYIGRYIYICDALDDLRNDCKKGNFNPLKIKFKFEKKELADEEFQKARDYCLESINLTMAELAENYVKLDQKHFKPINDNIVYLGMKNTFNLIYNERYNKKEKNKHNNK